MNWREQSAQAGQTVRATVSRIKSEWRRYLPAAGSVAAHGLALALALAVFAGPLELGDVPEPRSLAVTLIPEVAPPPPPPQAEPQAVPASAPSAPTDAEVIPDPERERRRAAQSEPAASRAETATDDDDIEVLPPSRSDVPLGLRSLLETNPCGNVVERLRGDCDSRWAELAAEGGLDYSPRLEELAKLYPGFQSEAASSLPGIPRAPERLSRKPSLAGGQVLAPLGSIRSGVGTAGGPADQTGRLPPPSALHADPAWELPPRWLGYD